MRFAIVPARGPALKANPMRTLPSRPIVAMLLAAMALPVAGCARNRTSGDLPYVARDVGTLYGAAKQKLDQRQYRSPRRYSMRWSASIRIRYGRVVRS